MNKDVKKAMSLIEEKEGRRREKLKKAEEETAETREKLHNIEVAMTSAENAEQYKELLKEKRDLEAVLEFCEKRVKEAKNDAITPEEYKAVIMETQKAFKALQDEKREAFREEIDRILKMFYSYDADVSELNKVTARLGILHRVAVPQVFNGATIAGDDEDMRPFVEAFYKVKNTAIATGRM